MLSRLAHPAPGVANAPEGIPLSKNTSVTNNVAPRRRAVASYAVRITMPEPLEDGDPAASLTLAGRDPMRCTEISVNVGRRWF